MFKQLIASLSVGLFVGVTGIAFALDEQVKRHNATLTCQPWQIKDSYRGTFGRVSYCRDPYSTSW